MSIVMVLMMIIAGMAVSLSVYFLLSGVFSFEPQLNANMVNEIGVPLSIVVFALCGPVLVLKLCFAEDGESDGDANVIGFLTTGCVSLFWSAVIGVFATQSIQAAIAPTIAQF